MVTHKERKAGKAERMKEREAFLDRLRVLATFAVIMLHTVSGVMDTTDMSFYLEERRVFMVALDLVCWCVPIFLLISGYLFLNPERQFGMGKMITKYGRRILLALFLFGVPFGCLELMSEEMTFRMGMLAEAFVRVLCGKSWAHMWYLYLILILYLLTPFLKRVLMVMPKWTVYGMLSVLFIGCSVLPYFYLLSGQEGPSLPGDAIYFFYYICGYLFAVEKKERLKKVVRIGILPALTALVVGGMAVSRLSGEYVLRMAYNYPFTVLLALLLFAWGMGTKCPLRPFWAKASELSFAVYLIHPLFLNLAYKFFHITPLSLLQLLPSGMPVPISLGISLLVFFTGTALLSVATAWMLCQIPPLKKYVL